MSQAPHVVHLRNGKKLGDEELVDSMIKDGFGMLLMVIIWEILQKMLLKNFRLQEKIKISLLLNHSQKALKAQKENKFDEEIVPFK